MKTSNWAEYSAKSMVRKSMKYLLISLLFTSSNFLISCTSAPKSDVSEAEINAEAAHAYNEIKAKSKISTNADWNAIVQRVASRIAKASGENFQWEYVLIESPEVNAWCMPGGKIAVYTGIMPVLKTEGALAAVLGHEVSHATLRHGMQSYARAKQDNYIGLAAAGASAIAGQFLCKTNNCRLLTQLGGAAAGFAITYYNRKFSRGEESAADQQGQIYMAKAGYDPAESIKLWERMSAAQKGAAPPEFMSTHPSDANRRANLTKWLPNAEEDYVNASPKYGVGEAIK
jgi:predicted Zn-dependent protease